MMIHTTCPCESAVAEAIVTMPEMEHWEAALRGHVEGCASCQDLVLVSSVLARDRREAWREAQVPTAGAIWWRATLRARLESTETAARPIGWVQGVTGAVATGVALALLGLAVPDVWTVLARLGGSEPLRAFAGSLETWWPLFCVVGVGLASLPVAFYYALSER